MSIIQSIIGTNLTISAGGGGGSPYINVYGWFNPMNEGQTNTAYVDYTNYPNTTIYWEIDNFDDAVDADWEGGVRPSGSFNVGGTGSTSFSWTAAADFTTDGGDGYVLRVGTTFGGSDIVNQYLTISDTSTAPAANFTIEWWQKVENSGNNPRPWSVGLYPVQKIAISYESMNSDFYWINDSYIGNVTRNHVTGLWEHMAFVRNNGVVKGYVNGVEYFSSNNGNSLITDTTTPLYVGTGEIAAGTYRGYLKDLHIIKGYAKYTSNFTPPSVPIIPYAGSKLLLNVVSDENKFTDNIASKSSTMTGTVTYSTDIPYTAAGPYTQYTGQYGLNGGIFVLTFAGEQYNADLLNVKAGWTVSIGGNPVATVSANAYESGGAIFIQLNVSLAESMPNTFTFTQPALGGSLYFNGSSYLNYGASVDWAMDV